MECLVCESFVPRAVNNHSLKKAKIPFGEGKMFFERAKVPFGERIVKRKACLNVFETALCVSGCNDIIYADCETCLKNRVDSYKPKIPQWVKNHRYSRLCSKVLSSNSKGKKSRAVQSTIKTTLYSHWNSSGEKWGYIHVGISIHVATILS